MAKLKDEVAAVMPKAAARRISAKEASILGKMGMSGALVNETARRLVTVYLENILTQAEVGDDDAQAVLNLLATKATSTQGELANKVLEKYLSKFAALVPAKEPVAA